MFRLMFLLIFIPTILWGENISSDSKIEVKTILIGARVDRVSDPRVTAFCLASSAHKGVGKLSFEGTICTKKNKTSLLRCKRNDDLLIVAVCRSLLKPGALWVKSKSKSKSKFQKVDAWTCQCPK